jgi:hypothetical protein
MCSTPRASGSIKKIYRIPSSKAYYKSQSQLMRKASEIYDRKQAKQAENHQHQNKLKDDSPNAGDTAEKNYKEYFRDVINLIISKIPPIVTT